MKNPAKKSMKLHLTAASAAVIAALAVGSVPAWADEVSYTVGDGQTEEDVGIYSGIEVNPTDSATITVQQGGTWTGYVNEVGKTAADNAEGATVSITVADGGHFIAPVYVWRDSYWNPQSDLATSETYFEADTKAKSENVTSLVADISGLWMGAISLGVNSNSKITVNAGGILNSTDIISYSDTVGGWPDADEFVSQVIKQYSNQDDAAYARSGGAAVALTAGKSGNASGAYYLLGGVFFYTDHHMDGQASNAGITAVGPGSDLTLDVAGTFYGPVYLNSNTATATIKIEKGGVWAYEYVDRANTYAPYPILSDEENIISDTYSNCYILPVTTAVADVASKRINDVDSPISESLLTDPQYNGGQFIIDVEGKWVGNALMGYKGEFNDPDTYQNATTAKEDNYHSFIATIGDEEGTSSEWIGTLTSKAGAWSQVTVKPGALWRYNPETVGTLTDFYEIGTYYDNSLYPKWDTLNVPTTVLGNAPAVVIALQKTDVDLTINGTLLGGALVSGQSAVNLSLGENGLWRAVDTAENPKDYEYQYVAYDVDDYNDWVDPVSKTANVTDVKTNRGPVTARVYGESSMTAGISGSWIGDAVVQDESSLSVTVNSKGSWHFSELNSSITSDTDETGVQDKTLAVVYGGSTLTLADTGTVTGLIQVQDSVTATEGNTAPAAFTGVVTGTWNGPLYVSQRGVAKVTVGGTAAVSDTGITISDTASNTGVWNITGTDTDGSTLTYAATQPAVAYATGTGSELDITVRQGGTLNGDVLITQAATGTVTNSGTWNGNAEADAGTLTITNAEKWTGDIWAKNGSTVTLKVTGAWTGTVKDHSLTEPTVTAYSSDTAAGLTSFGVMMAAAADTSDPLNVELSGSGSSWTMTESTELKSLSIDSGTVNFPTPAADAAFTGTKLTVNGDYSSDGGTIVMNTVLGDDNSATDQLIVTGNTSGTTNVKVNNVGGAGAQTTDGITLVEVAGDSSGTFTLANTVRGGAYVYSLSQAGKNWVLTSLIEPEPLPPNPNTNDDPTPDPDDPTPLPDPNANDDPAPAPTPDIRDHAVRPEAASYATNLYAANTMFTMKLSDRLGGALFSENLKSGGKNAGSFWLRTAGGHTRHEMADSQTTTRGNYGIVQLGGDLITWPSAGGQRFHAGLMAGYGHESSKTGSSVVNYQSKGKVDGYSVGLYGTWMNSDPTGAGPYVDTWLMWQKFKNKVDSSDYEVEESYHTKGFTASVEAGYTFRLKDWKGSSGFDNATRLRLEGQVIRMGVRGGDHFEQSTGTIVAGTGAGNVRTRVGLTAYHLFENAARGTAVKPYVTLNWLHDTKSFGAVMDGTKDTITGSRNIGEVKVGVEGKVTKNVNLWGAAGYQQGSHGLRNIEALLGAKILF